jgi:hypothetical protein
VLSVLKKPALRIPVVLVLVVGLGFYAMYSCQQQMKIVKLARNRHLSFIQLLARTVSTRDKMPARLGVLAVPAAPGELSAVERTFLEEFADLREFTEFAPPRARRAERLGEVRVWRAHGKPDDKVELSWSGYVFRMQRRGPENRDFAIFSWPLDAGPAQLTLAYVSTFPENIYYTASPRYAGPGNGPTLADLGEAPFEGRVFLLPPESAGETPEHFFARAEEHGGRIWAVENLETRKKN